MASLRKAVDASNEKDVAVLRTAAANGNQIVKSLFMLERNIDTAVQAHHHIQQQQQQQQDHI